MKEVVAPFELGTYNLDSCPFCGSDVDIEGIDNDFRQLLAKIYCSCCDAYMETYLAYGSKEPPKKKSLDDLVERWNRRVKT